MGCVAQHSTEHHSVLPACSALQSCMTPSIKSSLPAVISMVHHLFAHCNFCSMELCLLARRPFVASHKTGKSMLCMQDQRHLTLLQVLLCFVDHDNICGLSQNRQALLCKQDQHRLTLLQVLFSFVDYDDVCRRLQSRHLQPSLLGSSALIPYATLISLR